jgi:hypothetical protein
VLYVFYFVSARVPCLADRPSRFRRNLFPPSSRENLWMGVPLELF